MEKKREAGGALPATFYVAHPDDPTTHLSGIYSSSAEAEDRLAWLRQRDPRLELICRLVVFERCR